MATDRLRRPAALISPASRDLFNNAHAGACTTPSPPPHTLLSPFRTGQGHPLPPPPPPASPSRSSPGAPGSADALPPPARVRASCLSHGGSHESSTTSSAAPSRRASFGSEGPSGRDVRYGHGSGTSSLVESADAEHINTHTVVTRYDVTPSEGLLLYPEDVEKDDWLHNPDSNELDRERCNIWNRRGLVNIGALAFLTLGILVLFIGTPIITFIRQHMPPKPEHNLLHRS